MGDKKKKKEESEVSTRQVHMEHLMRPQGLACHSTYGHKEEKEKANSNSIDFGLFGVHISTDSQ